MQRFWLLFSFLILFNSTYTENRFVFIVPSYNNEEFCRQNLESLFIQTYTSYRVIYMNDASKDATLETALAVVDEYGMQDRVLFLSSTRRYGTLTNVYNAVHDYCDDDEILVFVDGDDHLAGPEVLTLLDCVYSNPNIWITYGNHMRTNDGGSICQRLPEKVIRENAYRQIPWVTSHLRTARSWLFKAIKLEDLLFKGRFLVRACDLAYMYPMLEMAGGRLKYIEDVLYVYNMHNPLSHFNKPAGQLYLEKKLKERSVYKPLRKMRSFQQERARDCSVGLIIAFDTPQALANNIFKLNTELYSFIAVMYKKGCDEEDYHMFKDFFPKIAFVEQADSMFGTLQKIIVQCPQAFSTDYYLMATDQLSMDEDIDLQQACRLLKQTHGYAFDLSGWIDQRLNHGTQDHSSFISGDVYAYQYGWPVESVREDDNARSFLFSKEAIFNTTACLLPMLRGERIEDEVFMTKVILVKGNVEGGRRVV